MYKLQEVRTAAHDGLPVQEMRRLREDIDQLNSVVYNPAGLNILWPRNVAFMFVSVSSFNVLTHSDVPPSVAGN